jgi:hypothetical protein
MYSPFSCIWRARSSVSMSIPVVLWENTYLEILSSLYVTFHMRRWLLMLIQTGVAVQSFLPVSVACFSKRCLSCWQRSWKMPARNAEDCIDFWRIPVEFRIPARPAWTNAWSLTATLSDSGWAVVEPIYHSDFAKRLFYKYTVHTALYQSLHEEGLY